MLAAFWPLYMIDIRLWHTEDRSYSGAYPINLYIRDQTEPFSEDDVEMPTDVEPES